MRSPSACAWTCGIPTNSASEGVATASGHLFLAVGFGHGKGPRSIRVRLTVARLIREIQKEVVRLDSSDAHAVVTALILGDTAQPPDRMRGIRIDLSGQASKDEVYLGEETLSAYKNALEEISQFTLVYRNPERDKAARGGTNYLGARLFWYGDNAPRVHALNAAT